jgi:hypothetical protein
MNPDRIRIPFRLAERLALLVILAILPLVVISAVATKDNGIYSLLFMIPVLLLLFWFWSGALPGSIEVISSDSFSVNPRAEKYSWLYNLDSSGMIRLPESKLFVVQDSGFQLKNDSLIIFNQDESIRIGSGEKIKPVLDWLIRLGLQSKLPID